MSAKRASTPGLAKSLRDTEARLSKEHRGRRIDFEVLIEGGSAVAKPLVR